MQQFYRLKAIKIFLFVFLLFAAGITNAQVGIGTPTPNASAQLDLTSTNRGFLPLRLTQAQRYAIATPAAGLIIWCKECGGVGELQVFNGGTWTNMSGSYPAALITPTITIGMQVWMTGLPGGQRVPDGSFNSVGSNSNWCSTSEDHASTHSLFGTFIFYFRLDGSNSVLNDYTYDSGHFDDTPNGTVTIFDTKPSELRFFGSLHKRLDYYYINKCYQS